MSAALQDKGQHFFFLNFGTNCPKRFPQNMARVAYLPAVRRGYTELIHFPLYCPKCKKESLVNVKQQTVLVIKEPDALTQSR